MYKNNSKNMQGRASRISYKDVVKSNYIIPIEEEYENLKNRYFLLQTQILQTPKGDLRVPLAKKFREIQLRLTELKPLVKANNKNKADFVEFFIKSARNILPEHTFNSIWKEAEIIYNQIKKEAVDVLEQQDDR